MFLNRVYTKFSQTLVKSTISRKTSKFGFSASAETKVYTFHGDIDPVEIVANYELSGLFFFIPIRAVGIINVVGRHIDYKVDAIYELVPKHGVDFAEIKKVIMKAYIKDGTSWIGNLGPFEVAINRIINNRLNARFIMDHLSPVIEDSVGYILQKFSNRIFNSVPYDKLLPKGTGPVPETTVTPEIYNATFISYKKEGFLSKIINSLY